MQRSWRCAAPLLLLLAFGHPVLSQCNANAGPMSLTINGLDPASVDPGHRVPVVAGEDFLLEINDGDLGSAFVLVAGADLSCGVVPVPWGGSIDLVAPTVVADGLNPNSPLDSFASTDFRFAAASDCTMAGTSTPAFQAVYIDPNNLPFFLSNTGSGIADFVGGTTVYDALADDESVLHVFGSCGGVSSITFGGVSYTQFFVGSNGVVSFGEGAFDWEPSSADFFSGFPNPQAPAPLGANPGVALIWQDYARDTLANDRVVVTEDAIAGTVRVSYESQEHWNSQMPAGSWSGTFGSLGPNSVVIDGSGYIAGDPALADADPIIGVSDGLAGGSEQILDLSVALSGPYQTMPGNEPESIMEQFPAAGTDPGQPFDIGVVNFVDSLGTFFWSVF